ncbi:MAG TPA: hypothetical protein VGL62_11455 [Vicinamibacterales bacterium]|jgi:hypothetical protein
MSTVRLFRVLRGMTLAAGIASLSTGCASTSAKTGGDQPALNVPPPPPHVVTPPELPSEPEPVGELPPPSVAPTTTRPRREATPKPSDTKTDVKPGETKPVEAMPPEAAPAAPPPAPPKPPADTGPQLVTPQTADTTAAVNGVRATMDRALGLLNSVDYRTLSPERKKAYDDAKLFLQGADNALKQNNLQAAQGEATKAETLARALAGK